MLMGEYLHTLDEKNRTSLPSKLRRELGQKVILTRGLDNCLLICRLDQWQKIFKTEARIGLADKRDIDRFLLASAAETEVDKAGRFLIPENLKSFAGLRNKIIFAGVGDRVEVWDRDRWQRRVKGIERQADQLAERLGQMGAL